MTDETTAPIRIARIITRLNVGGPAIQAVQLGARLESFGYHTLLIHGRLGPGEGDMSYLLPREPRFDVEYIPSLGREVSPLTDFTALARVVFLLDRFKPAIVHTHTAKAGAIGRAAALLYNATAGRRASARIVHTYHGHVLDRYFGPATSRAFSAVERFLGQRSDALLTVAPLVRRELLERHRIGDADRFRLVPLGLDLAPLAAIGSSDRVAARSALSIDRDARVVSLVGRLTAIKQPGMFLDAAVRIRRVDPRAIFLIVGGGDLEAEVRSTAARLGLQDHVRFFGWQRDMATIYAATDILALTSRNEGTPVAVIEAMAAGVPAVAFSVGGVPDVIADGSLGVLVPEGDVETLATTVHRLLEDSGTRLAMSAHARASVCERFAIDRLLRDVDSLYRELLGLDRTRD